VVRWPTPLHSIANSFCAGASAISNPGDYDPNLDQRSGHTWDVFIEQYDQHGFDASPAAATIRQLYQALRQCDTKPRLPDRKQVGLNPKIGGQCNQVVFGAVFYP